MPLDETWTRGCSLRLLDKLLRPTDRCQQAAHHAGLDSLPTSLYRADMLGRIPPPPGFIARCLPTRAESPPSGPVWLHEIKHDGFRIIARKDDQRVRLYSRPGNDL